MLSSFEIAPVRASLASSRWLTCPRPDSTAPLRLWCVPFAGSGAAVWHAWAAALAGLAEIVSIRPPGRESRLAEAPLVSLWDYVTELMVQIAPYANEDYVLCGHSLGALVAFELVRGLRTRGLGLPRALIVCGARAPHHLPDRPLLHTLPRHEFISQVERRYGAIPAELRDHPEFLDLLLPALRADLEMYETYQHTFGPPIDIPVLALGGEDDAIVSRAQVLDWRAHASGDFEAEILPGDHFFPQDNMAATTQRVREFLGRCGYTAPSRHAYHAASNRVSEAAEIQLPVPQPLPTRRFSPA